MEKRGTRKGERGSEETWNAERGRGEMLNVEGRRSEEVQVRKVEKDTLICNII